jgi:hypothetical protein
LIADWTVPFTLVTPNGTVILNDATGATNGYYAIDASASEIGPTVRAEANDIPQADGSILHRRFLTGVEAKIVLQLWQTDELPSCDTNISVMHDFIFGAVRSLLNAGDNEGRLRWTPQGGSERMLDDIRLLVYPTQTLSDGIATVEFTVDTAYPYAIDLTQTAPTINSTSGTITMTGTADFWPVIQVFGPCDTFGIVNSSVLDELGNPLGIFYDSGFPGAISIPGGSYAEIDCFRNTVYLDGDGANLKPGIDVTGSDFFPLVVGANNITTTESTTFLVNNAWA